MSTTTPTPSAPVPAATRRKLAIRGGVWSAASQILPAFGTAALSVAAGRYLGSAALGQQSLIAYVNSATASVVVVSLNTALIQIGGRLQGLDDGPRLEALYRWAVRAQLASGLLVLAVMAFSASVVHQYRGAWLILGTVSVLDALADGLSVRLVLTEGWAPMGRLRLVFQLLGPPLGLLLLFAGYGVPGIFVGDGLAALGLAVAAGLRYRTVRRRRAAGTGAAGPPAAGGVRVTAGVTDLASPDGALPAAADVTLAPAGVAAAAAGPARTGRGRRRRPEPPSRSARWLRPPAPVRRTAMLFAVAGLITQVVGRRVEFLVLAAFGTDDDVAIYSVAFMAVNLVAMVPLGVAAAAMPLVAAAEARGEAGAATGHLRFALRIGSSVSVPLVALLAATGPSAIALVYGPAYGSAARLVPLASVGLLVAVVTGVCTEYWSGQGRLSIVLRAGFTAAAVDLAVAFAAVPALHATGAVLANLAGQVTLAVGLVRATVRRTGPIGWSAPGLVRAVVVGLAGAAAVTAVRVGLGLAGLGGGELRAGLELVLGGAAGLAAVVAVACRVPLFTAAEADWLRPLVPGRARALLARTTTAVPRHRGR